MSEYADQLCSKFKTAVAGSSRAQCALLIVVAIVGLYKVAQAIIYGLMSLVGRDTFRNPQLLGWNMYGGNMPNWRMGSEATGGLFEHDASPVSSAVYAADVRGVGGVRVPQPAVYANMSRMQRENMLGADEVDSDAPVADSIQFPFDPTACSSGIWGPEAMVEAQGLAYMGGMSLPATSERRLLKAAATAFNQNAPGQLSEEADEDVAYLSARGMAP